MKLEKTLTLIRIRIILIIERKYMTKYGQMILDIINQSLDHLTAEQIFFMCKEKNEKIVLATVYNNLSNLCNQGLIRKVSIEGSPDRYDRIQRHDHIICKECGKISDITLQDLTESLQKQLEFQIDSYDLKINYICPECQNEKK